MTEDFNLFLIDTNVLVYASEKGESSRNKDAKELIDRCWKGKDIFAISSQNLAEFVFVTTRKAKLDLKEAEAFAGFIVHFQGFKKISYNQYTVMSAIEIADQFKMSFWDSLLAATMRENGIFNIYTENAKDFKMPWINAVNPFT
ncbi:PIN domain-containing protein [Candidatus Woesearchaeota archaeon]|nr:PIN domain-containing protein [Candidatus Woesearchaeota archaeon]